MKGMVNDLPMFLGNKKGKVVVFSGMKGMVVVLLDLKSMVFVLQGWLWSAM